MLKKLLYAILLTGLLSNGSMARAQDLNPSQWPNLTGYWKFQNAANPLKATVGNDLKLTGSHSVVQGPSRYDTAIRIGTGSYYRADHNITPNGGGDSVNRYTLLFDFKILSLNRWHTFFQTDTSNKNDGECFIRPKTESGPGRIGTATTGYTPDSVRPNQWYRLMVSVNLGHFYRYYLNGELILEGDTQNIDGRFALNPYFLLFADNNQEDDTIDIASVAVFDTCLSSAQIASIGTIDPCVLYPMQLSLGRDTNICGSNTLSKTLTKGYSYRWSTGDTASSLTFSAQTMGSGLKSVWVNMRDQNNCEISDTFLLGFYSYPTLNLGTDLNICKPNSVTLNGGPAPGFSYEWKYLPAGNVVSKTNTMRTDSSGLYSLRATNQYGCTAHDSIRITVHDNTAKPAITASKTDFCYGDTASVYGPAGFVLYQWSNGILAPSQTIDTSISLRLRTTNAWGCTSPLSDLFKLTAHLPPATPQIRNLSDTVFCAGDSCLLMVFGSYAGYHWNDSFKGFSRQVKTGGTFRVYVTDIYGCNSAYSAPVSVYQNPVPDKPSAVLTQGFVNLCPGDSAVLSCPDSAFKYLWNNGKSDRWISVKTSGTFSLRTENEYGCFSEASDSVQLILHPLPLKPVILALGKDSLTCNTDASEYKWIKQGRSGYISGRSIAAEDSGVYFVLVKNDWCWSEGSAGYTFYKTGINNTPSLHVHLQIYPNPTNGAATFKLNGATGNCRLDVYHISGQKVFSKTMHAQDLQNGFTTDISYLNTGVYIVVVHTGSGTMQSRLLIETAQ